MNYGRGSHGPPNQIVSQAMYPQLLPNHIGKLAAKILQIHRDLVASNVYLNVPSLPVQISHFALGVLLRRGQGRDKYQLRCTGVGRRDGDSQLTNGKLVVFCPWRMLSFIYVLEFNSATERQKLDVESEVFHA